MTTSPPHAPRQPATVSFLVVLAVVLELLVGIALLLLPDRNVADSLHTVWIALLLLGPVPVLLLGMGIRQPGRRWRILAIAALAIAVQCVVLIFGTGPIYPIILGMVLIELFTTRHNLSR